MLLLGTINTTTQVLTTDDLINFGQVYRRYDKKNECGYRAFELGSNSITLQHSGIYHLTATITFTAPTAGDVIFQLTQNGVALNGATATETITTADTEIKTTTLDYYVLVNKECVLNQVNTIDNIAITLTGVDATIENVIVNITKEV